MTMTINIIYALDMPKICGVKSKIKLNASSVVELKSRNVRNYRNTVIAKIHHAAQTCSCRRPQRDKQSSRMPGGAARGCLPTR